MGCNRVCPKTDTCSKTHFLRFRVATQIVLCVRVIDSLVFLPVDQAVLQHGLQQLLGDLVFVGRHRIHQRRISESRLHIVCSTPLHIRPCNQGNFYRHFPSPYFRTAKKPAITTNTFRCHSRLFIFCLASLADFL